MKRKDILLVHGAFSGPRHLQAWGDAFVRAGFGCLAPPLPGHAPSDPQALDRLTMRDYRAALLRIAATFSAPPILIGHSMGGLLAQQLAALVPCRALVLVASAPPWMLPAPARALPLLAPMLPRILAGRCVHAGEATLRGLVLHDLPEPEQQALLPTFGAESGRAYRAMIFGRARLAGERFRGPVLCLSGGADRIITPRSAQALARFYGATHQSFPDYGHWLIAPSRADEMTACIAAWLAQRAQDD